MTAPSPTQPSPIPTQEMGKLRWRCRRGLLENDLLLERFFSRHGSALTQAHVRGLMQLMELTDNDLLDLLLHRSQPTGALDNSDVRAVLALV